TRPNASVAVRTSAWHWAGLVTSVGTVRRSPPAFAAAATAASFAGSRPAMTTFAPSRRNARATALPTPDPPPVTTATLPASLLMVRSVGIARGAPDPPAATGGLYSGMLPVVP